jgi:hypothetical protein
VYREINGQYTVLYECSKLTELRVYNIQRCIASIHLLLLVVKYVSLGIHMITVVIFHFFKQPAPFIISQLSSIALIVHSHYSCGDDVGGVEHLEQH